MSLTRSPHKHHTPLSKPTYLFDHRRPPHPNHPPHHQFIYRPTLPRQRHPYFGCFDWEKVLAKGYQPEFVPPRRRRSIDVDNFDKCVLRVDVSVCVRMPYPLSPPLLKFAWARSQSVLKPSIIIIHQPTNPHNLSEFTTEPAVESMIKSPTHLAHPHNRIHPPTTYTLPIHA